MATANYNTALDNQSYTATPAVSTGLINAYTTQPATQGQAFMQAPAATYTGTQATAADWQVNPNQTVQSQVKDIIADNSPLMQQAETRALQKANTRGLLNSSLAVGAGQAAVFDAATPIATSDAATYARAGEFNAGARQQVGLANQASKNAADQFNANSANQVNSQNSQLQTNVSLNNASQSNELSKFNASQVNDVAKYNLAQSNDLAKFNATASNDLLKLGMDAQSKTNLANIEANYKVLMQSSDSAAGLYRQMVINASSILTNKDMDAAAKTAAINNQVALLNSGLGVIGSIGNLNLGSLLNFDSVQATSATAASATAYSAPPSYSNNYDYSGAYL